MSGSRLLPWVALTLVIAVIVHGATLVALPHFIMSQAMSKMGAINTIHHGRRVDETSRGVVRPSPDLLYSSCPYDLSAGPLRVHAPVPPGTYWSVSAFDADTDNYFVRNDRQSGGVVDFYVVHGAAALPPGATTILSPTRRGLLLFRTLINDGSHFASIDAARRLATCATVGR